MIDKVKKYLLPNISYLFIFWVFLKLGTAYRIAVGTNFGMKLISMMAEISPAFGKIAPGYSGLDWLVGIAGTAVIRLIIYQKVSFIFTISVS